MAINPLAINPLLPTRYLHIAFHFVGQPLTTQLEPVFDNMSGDWIRYTPNCWITWTQKDLNAWFNALKPYLHGEDGIVILELQPPLKSHGWRPKWVWDWLNKQRL